MNKMSLALYNEFIQQGLIPLSGEIKTVAVPEGFEAYATVYGKHYATTAPKKKDAMQNLADLVIHDRDIKPKPKPADSRKEFFSKGGKVRISAVYDGSGVVADTTFFLPNGAIVEASETLDHIYALSEFVKRKCNSFAL